MKSVGKRVALATSVSTCTGGCHKRLGLQLAFSPGRLNVVDEPIDTITSDAQDDGEDSHVEQEAGEIDDVCHVETPYKKN